MTGWEPTFPQSEKPLCDAIADEIEAAIASGRLRPGDRLPTHREMAQRLQVGIGTVTHAYSIARDRGLLAGEIGRGTYVLSSGATGRPFEHELGFLLPERDFADALRAALATLARRPRLSEALMDAESLGAPRVREAAAEWMRWCGLEADPARIIATSGMRQITHVAINELVETGQVVACEQLSWSSGLARIYPGRFVGVPLDTEGIIPDALDEVCRNHPVRMLLCNPSLHMPTSAVMSQRRREQVAEVCLRHNLWLLEDDPGGPLIRDEVRPLANLLPDQAIYCSDPSPLVHPGVRACYLHLPPSLVERVARVFQACVGRGSHLEHEVMRLWFEDGTAQRLMQVRRVDYQGRQRVASKALKGLSYQTHPSDSDIWLRLPESWESREFSKAAREHGCHVDPGHDYEVTEGAGRHGVCLHLGTDSLTDLPEHLAALRSLVTRES